MQCISSGQALDVNSDIMERLKNTLYSRYAKHKSVLCESNASVCDRE